MKRDLYRTLLMESGNLRKAAVSHHQPNLDPVPAMPVMTPRGSHRPKLSPGMPPVHALIARPVGKAEIKGSRKRVRPSTKSGADLRPSIAGSTRQ